MDKINWIIAAVGNDAVQTRKAGFACLHLCMRLNADGKLIPLSYPAGAGGDYLGITDGGGVPYSGTAFAAAAIHAAKVRGCIGLMADFERAELFDTVQALNTQAKQEGLQLLIPLAHADAAPDAILIADTAISGGSLLGRFEQLANRYTPQRLAAQLVCSCADFLLPSRTPDGTPLTREQMKALLDRTRSSVFFSRELCAKYFTYTQNSQAHFVLFDDGDTLSYKAKLLAKNGISAMLAVYPDAERLGLFSDV